MSSRILIAYQLSSFLGNCDQFLPWFLDWEYFQLIFSQFTCTRTVSAKATILPYYWCVYLSTFKLNLFQLSIVYLIGNTPTGHNYCRCCCCLNLLQNLLKWYMLYSVPRKLGSIYSLIGRWLKLTLILTISLNLSNDSIADWLCSLKFWYYLSTSKADYCVIHSY